LHPINITIARKSDTETFSIASTKVSTLLAALYEIKATLDPTLTFGAGCRSGICGSCAVLVNGKEQLACSYRHQDGDHIAPLRYHPVVRDLKVDKTYALGTLTKILSGYSTPDPIGDIPSPKEETQSKVQTDCILCDSCYSACPVLAVNPDFLGPFALTRAWRYLVNDKKAQGNGKTQDKGQAQGTAPTGGLLEKIQTNGIWDCTLCGECTAACPQGIDPKTDILMLRGASGKAGYSDPNFGSMDFGTPSFGTPDFGART